ncbi:MAG: hypothetical protein HY216_13515 [Candidatus Rokubacteria bacterium]|nr:hypothetical protein [Candidatus Rokubacteria bacterium]
MRMIDRGVRLIVLTVAFVGCAGRVVSADGPYSGRVVDAETKQPLAGAVVLAIWMKHVPVGAHMPESFVDAVEVVTDANGEFTISAKTHTVVFGRLQEPEFVIFYPGYGYAPRYQVRPRLNLARELQSHAIVELPQWKVREDRLRVDGIQNNVSRVPPDRMPKLIQQTNVERRFLGLPNSSLGRGTP